MVGCCAEFCNNSSTKGYTMKIFPRDSKRRAQWAEKVNRENWTPTNNSYLCEVHFASDMWEQRLDQKKKLKPNAIPTIFGFFLKKRFEVSAENLENQSKRECGLASNKNKKNQNTNKNIIINEENQGDVQDQNKNQDEDEITIKEENQDNAQDQNKNQDEDEITINEENQGEAQDQNKNQDEDEVTTNEIIEPSTSKEKEIEKETSGEIKKSNRFNLIYLRKQNKVLKHRIQTLKNKLNSNKYKQALNRLLTEDQIEILLKNKNSIKKWSNNTIYRALKLKFTCGITGYKELIKQGMPLPSLRTLRRRLESLKVQLFKIESISSKK